MIKLTNIHIEYDKVLLDNEDFELYDHEITLIYGLSGTGKTTLLYRIGLLSSQDQEYEYQGEDITYYTEKQKSNVRQMKIGYVMQDSNIFEQYDVLGNLELYSSLTGKSYSREEYQNILDRLRLEIEFTQPIQTLSGGERQRLAIACALCKDVEILILDEPTSALDNYNAFMIFDIFEELKQEKTILLVSHDHRAKEYADRIYNISETQLHLEKEGKKSNYQSKNTKYSYPFTFYKKYILYFFNAYKGINTFMLTIFLLLSFLVATTLLYTNKLTNENIRLMKETCVNQLYVQVDDTKLNYLENNNDIEAIYPYVNIKAGIEGVYYDVYPYYEKDSVIDSLEITLNNHGDVYTSSEMYKSIFYSSQSTSDNILFDFAVEGKSEYIEFEYALEVGGILEENTKSYYGSDNFLYVPNDFFQELIDISGIETYEYYTVFTKDYDSLLLVIDTFENNNLHIESSFNNIESIEYVMKEMNILRIQLLTVIFITSVFFITILQLTYFYKRNIEFSLLKINGLNNFHILLLIFYELSAKAMIALLLSIPLFTLVNIVMLQSGLKLTYFIFIISLIMILITMASTCINYLYLKKMELQKIIRT